jgi:hypothetical protein
MNWSQCGGVFAPLCIHNHFPISLVSWFGTCPSPDTSIIFLTTHLTGHNVVEFSLEDFCYYVDEYREVTACSKTDLTDE